MEPDARLRFQIFVDSRTARNLRTYELSSTDGISILSNPCWCCGDTSFFLGHHVFEGQRFRPENCFPACGRCYRALSKMRWGPMDVKNAHTQVAKHTGMVPDDGIRHDELFLSAKTRRPIANYVREPRGCELSKEQIRELDMKPCSYCGKSDANGIDRMVNTLGYTVENSTPCCKTCNFMKGSMDREPFLQYCQKIALWVPHEVPSARGRVDIGIQTDPCACECGCGCGVMK